MWLAAVVCTPSVQNKSFIPIGTPAILPSGLPAARSASTACAASIAFSGVSTMKALSAFALATFALKAVATSTAVNAPEVTPERIAATPSFVSSLIRPLRHAELVSASIVQHDQSLKGWIDPETSSG
jgi:hypothetical protein